MITTKKGVTTITGTRAEIFADLYAILMAAHDKIPDILLEAAEKFVEYCDDAERFQVDISDELRLEAFAAMLSHLPKEEQERLKKKLKE